MRRRPPARSLRRVCAAAAWHRMTGRSGKRDAWDDDFQTQRSSYGGRTCLLGRTCHPGHAPQWPELTRVAVDVMRHAPGKTYVEEGSWCQTLVVVLPASAGSATTTTTAAGTANQCSRGDSYRPKLAYFAPRERQGDGITLSSTAAVEIPFDRAPVRAVSLNRRAAADSSLPRSSRADPRGQPRATHTASSSAKAGQSLAKGWG